jgi:DegV family protein with EDD domain
VSIHISSSLSGTINSAMGAAAQVAHKRIRVVDSRTVSLAMGYLVQTAAEAAHAGAKLDEIAALIDANIPKAGFYAVLDSLQHAQRSGRLGSAQALLGSVLQIKPIIGIRDGTVQAIDRPRTMRKALDRVAELLAHEAPFLFLGVPHAANESMARELAERLSAISPGQVDVIMTGPVIGTHCGPGAVAVCYLKR